MLIDKLFQALQQLLVSLLSARRLRFSSLKQALYQNDLFLHEAEVCVLCLKLFQKLGCKSSVSLGPRV